MTVDQYLRTEETNRHRELLFGVLHDPPSPFPYHQAAVLRLASRLEAHVAENGSGQVYISPLDVILDEARHLVLQPDILYISSANQGILRDRIYGAPDVVIEVLSAGTRHRDRTAKRHWYLHYGVREYWLVDPRDRIVEIAAGPSSSSLFRPGERLRSEIFPRFTPAIDALFSDDPA